MQRKLLLANTLAQIPTKNRPPYICQVFAAMTNF